jgi:hypothetical protein
MRVRTESLGSEHGNENSRPEIPVRFPTRQRQDILENVSRGEYRLNPVGYNLVVHGLPRSNAPAPSGAVRRKVGKRGGRRQ